MDFLNKVKLFNLKHNHEPVKIAGGTVGALIVGVLVAFVLSILEQPKYPFDFIDGEVMEEDPVAE